jgi:3-hydroxyacyl-[acyl-carrier-protein] dehydratase
VPRRGDGLRSARVDQRLPAPTDLLPHRPPFLFVDEILDLVPGDSARARWFVDPASPFFAGHFPGNPILPGVIIVEALAQTGALAALAEPGVSGKLALFAGIGRARFKRVVRPGDELLLETRLTRRRGMLGSGEGVATVDGVLACKTELSFALVDADEAAG